MKKLLVIFIVFVAVSVISVNVYAQPADELDQPAQGVMGGKMGGQAAGMTHDVVGKRMHGQQKSDIFKGLNLTAEQQKKLEENRKAQNQELVKLFQAMKQKQSQLKTALDNPASTRASIDPIVKDIKLIQSQLIDHRINGIFAVKKILTPEQYVQFQQNMRKVSEDIRRIFQKKRSMQATSGQEHLDRQVDSQGQL